MNKRKKELSEGNNEHNVSKAKRSLAENSQLTAEDNFEIPVQPHSNDSAQKSKPTTAETKQEWEEKSQENAEALAENLKTSSNDKRIMSTSELQQLSQTNGLIFLSLSQNSSGKFVPVFAKPKKNLTETSERNNGEAAGLQTEQTLMMHKHQEILESNLQCTDNSLPCESSEVNKQEAKSPSGSFQLMQTEVQEGGDTAVPHCERCISEGLDVKTENQHKITNISIETAMIGDAHQGTGIASNLQEDNCDKNTFVELSPLFPDTLCRKDASSPENRNLSLGSLECPIEKDVSYLILAQHRICDGGEESQNEHLLNSCLDNVDQKKPSEEDAITITPGNFLEEEKGTVNVHGEGTDVVHTSFKSTMESSLSKSQLLVNLNIITPEEQNNVCTSDTAEKQSSSDKGADQSGPFKDAKAEGQNNFQGSVKTAEHSNLCRADKIADQSSSKSSGKAIQQSSPCIGDEIIVEQRSSCKVIEQSSPQSSGKFLEQKSPHSSGKVVKQGSPRNSGRVLEKIGSDKDFLGCTQSMIVDLKMHIEVTESKSIQTTETVSLICLQTEGCDHLECSSTSLQPASYTGESSTGKEEEEQKREKSEGTRVEYNPDASTLLINSKLLCENNQEDHITLKGWKENGCEKVRPDTEQSLFSTSDSRNNVLDVKQSNTEIVPQAATQIPETGMKSSSLSLRLLLNAKNSEEMVTGEKSKMHPVPMKNCLFPIDVLEQLKREKITINHKGEIDAISGGKKSLSAADTGLPSGAQKDPPPVDQTSSSWENALPLDLELLPDSQLQCVLEDKRVQFSLEQPFSVDTNCSPSIPESDMYPERKQHGSKTSDPVTNLSYPNKQHHSRVEMMERGCDPAKEEDATDVVCGLIIELSNLNRLIMNTHRDLESLKRLKYRKSRQSGRCFTHALKGATNTVYTVKKWKEI
ncbi:break repair meiotic recombinase recruitment factor 1 [Carettochelys insculpta]|uniref:break repair meiotic recombinase recruitment factor 1 n=1 Tax=Carettochelys insculpta TaxID=44489 RepID=UPI003EBD768A